MVNPNTFREWPKASVFKRTGKPTFKKPKKPKRPKKTTLLNDLVAWWSVNETANTATRVDAHTNSYDMGDGADVGAASGKVNNSAVFGSGFDLRRSAASAPLLDYGDTDFTFAGWVKPTSTQGNTGICGMWTGSGSYNVGFSTTGNNTLTFTVRGSSLVSAAIYGTVPNGTWVHFVCWHDAVNNEIGIIVNDGTPETVAKSDGVTTGATDFYIGNYTGFNGMTGEVDELATWSRLLTSKEVTALYNSGDGITYPAPAPVYIGPDIDDIEYAVDSAITPVDTSVLFTGSGISYSQVGSWPTGITIDPVSGIISGTPTGAEQAYPNLVVRATTVGGVADATAYQITLTAAVYDPGMMDFTATGYYTEVTHTTVGNKVTAIIRFNRASFSGGLGFEGVLTEIGGSTAQKRVFSIAYSADNGTPALQNKISISVRNSAGTTICLLVSTADLCDGADHVMMFSFDGDAGTAQFIVDGVDEDDTGHASRVAPTTGTLDSGASSDFVISALDIAGGAPFLGKMGYVWLIDSYLTNHGDFMDGSTPLLLDTAGWTELGGQPLFGQDEGEMDKPHLGSAPNMTANGTITGPA